MSSVQVISFVFIVLSIYFLLNLKFKVQRFINTVPKQTADTLIKSKRSEIKINLQ